MTSPADLAVVIVAAGAGMRAGGAVPKQFRRLGAKTVVAHAFDSLANAGTVFVVAGGDHEELARSALAGRSYQLVRGGATRRESVRAGLEMVARAGGAARVLIHDAARLAVPSSVLQRLIVALDTADGAIPVLPVVDSVVEGSTVMGSTVDRSTLRRVQTPQAFRFETILRAHRIWTGSEPTDDAQMVHTAGGRVALVEGDVALEKITVEADFARAEQRLGLTRTSRTGMGFDVHRLADGEELWLGGIRIPHHHGLAGHSDADVALHALVDAVLGALAEGDIGSHFPPTDPQWRGASSARFLEFARDRVLARGGVIDHVDLTLICEAPKIGPHREAMRARIAELLRIELERVSVKATTTERLGFAGRGEGIAAQAVATISLPQ
jgi:2-C-methyl-D-erythritol 4-phosphate cytidylyltransferase/2-C-methyl-D-erythritol 2,4-cyclodiphosphate synthase